MSRTISTFHDARGRVCPKCGDYKIWDCFYTRPSGSRRSYCQDCWALNSRQNLQLKKQQAMDAYGGKCACCGESQVVFLTIDHINNDGAKHRREIGKPSGSNFYSWLNRQYYPEGFQVLCWNCNAGKQLNEGICPHQIR
jgi:predicted RNA-binding Zn-ribbon protein involved in translation (DUF1610 family)